MSAEETVAVGGQLVRPIPLGSRHVRVQARSLGKVRGAFSVAVLDAGGAVLDVAQVRGADVYTAGVVGARSVRVTAHGAPLAVRVEALP